MQITLFIDKNMPLCGSPVCGSEDLPEVDFDICNPNVKTSEIRRVFLGRVGGADFNDWTQRAEWNIRLSETAQDQNALRPLMVLGDKPTPNSIRKAISFDRKKTVLKTHTVNATIDDVSDTNHEFVRSIGNGRFFKMWYETTGGYMFGGNKGITCYVEIDMILPRGQGEIMTYAMNCGWSSLRTEDRCLSPIFTDAPTAFCAPIASFSASSITDDGFDFGWTGPSDANYQWAISTSPIPPTSGYSTVAAGIGVSLTGLLPDTDYYIYVRVVCSDGGLSTIAVNTVHTLAAAPVLPVTSGLILFAAAEYGVELDMGGKIQKWNDLSGMNNHLLPQTFPQWDVNPMVMNGKPGVHMGGSGCLQTVGDLVGLTATDEMTIFWVTHYPVLPFAEILFIYAPIDEITLTDGFGIYQQNPGGAGHAQNFIRVKGNIGVNQQIMNTTHDAVHLYSAVCNKALGNTTEIVLKRDKIINQVPGTGGANNNNLVFGSYKFTVGSYGDGIYHTGGSIFAVGNIGKIIIYNRALNATEVDLVTDNLMTDYGL